MTLSSSHSPSGSATGKALRVQRRDDAIFAIHGMRAGQELAGRLAAQDVAARGA
jgi:hypothetical protein